MAINFPEGTQNYPGRVHRVYHAAKTDTQTISIASSGENVWYDVSSLSIAIAPRSTSNVLIGHMHIQAIDDSDHNDCGCMFRFADSDGNGHGVGAAAGSRLRFSCGSMYSFGAYQDGGSQWDYLIHSYSASFYYAPNSTNSVTYKVQGRPGDASHTTNTLFINRSRADNNVNPSDGGSAEWQGRACSSLIIYELEPN